MSDADHMLQRGSVNSYQYILRGIARSPCACFARVPRTPTLADKAFCSSSDDLAYSEGIDYGAVSGYESYVVIERSYQVLGQRVWTVRHSVAGARVGLGQLQLKWDGSNRLSVDCTCDRDAILFSENTWRDVKVMYSFSAPGP